MTAFFASPTGIWWADVFVVAALLVTSVGVLWRKVVRPLRKAVTVIAHMVKTVEDVAPVLIDIGQEFKPDHGSTLKDIVTEIRGTLSTVLAAQTEMIATQSEQSRKIDALHDYAHDTRHDQAAQIAGLAHFDETVTRKLDELASKVNPMPAKLDELAAAASASDAQMAEHRGHEALPPDRGSAS